MKIRPLHDRVVVRRKEEEEKTAGGISAYFKGTVIKSPQDTLDVTSHWNYRLLLAKTLPPRFGSPHPSNRHDRGSVLHTHCSSPHSFVLPTAKQFLVLRQAQALQNQ